MPGLIDLGRHGAWQVLQARDGVFRAPAAKVTHHLDGEAETAALHRRLPEELALDVNFYVLRRGDEVVLVDAGGGGEYGDALGHGLEAMRAAGIAPGQVSRILLTHVHGDHVGGLHEGGGRRFPNATVHAPEADLVDAAPGAEGRRGLAAKLRETYGERLVPLGEGEALPGVRVLPLPGHTPGHVGFLLEGDAPLLLSGDVLHLAEHQIGDPAIAMRFDEDAHTAVATRRQLLADAAARNWRVVGGHVSTPPAIGG